MAKRDKGGMSARQKRALERDDQERLKSRAPHYNLSGGSIPFRGRTSSKNRLYRNIRRLVILVLLISLLLLLVNNLRTSRQSQETDEKISAAYNPSFKTRYEDVGALVVQNYLSGKASPISYTQDVQWKVESPLLKKGGEASENDYSKSQNANGDKSQSGQNPEVTQVTYIDGKQTDLKIPSGDQNKFPEIQNGRGEVLTYYAVYNGQPLYLSVSLAVPNMDDPSVLPILMTSPNIQTPDTIKQYSGLQNSPKGDLSSTDVSEDGMSQLKRWAKAWAEDDQGSLIQIANDNDASHTYAGIGNWTAQTNTVKVDWAYTKKFPGNDENYTIAEVEFDMTQNGSSDKKYTNKQTMDVVIGNVDKGLPTVVSWGPAGTWSSLEPYDVARTLEKGEQRPQNNSGDSSADPASSPSSSSSSMASPSASSKR